MIHNMILLTMLLTQHIIEITCQGFTSPCPNIFQYQLDQSTNQMYGLIQITSSNSNIVLLNIELSIGNPVRGYNGIIELAKPKKEVINDIIFHRPILYKVFFPVWHRLPPRITKILVNGDLVCSGPKIPIGNAPVVTTINLQHTLRVDYQPLSYPSKTPVDNSIGNPVDISKNPFLKDREPLPDPQIAVPDERLPTKIVNTPETSRPTFLDERSPPPNDKPLLDYASDFGTNQYNFNPTLPKGSSSPFNVNFRPKMPKDPSIIYPGNPFFSSSSSNPLRNNNSDSNKPIKLPQPITPTPEEFKEVVPKRNLAYSDICGRSVATNSLVVHGNAVPAGAYPWLAAIFAVKDTGLNYMCSASLISDRHVVTAAHCVRRDNKKFRPQDLIIILGKLNIQRWTQTEGEKIIDPESIHIHPDYQPLTSDADIAVLTLSEKLQFTKLIRPICLWSTESSDLQLIVGQKGTVVGWGRNENGDLMTAEPKQINLPIVSQETCLRSSYTFADITSNRTFCAGDRDGSGPCNGDSGSGFIMKRGDRWILRGIVSISISDSQKYTCDLKNYVVFTDASKFLTWLLSFIE